MEVDPNSLDPELRTARFFAIASPALGLISLCGAIIPICGGIASLLGIITGLASLKTEHSKSAIAGVAISVLGMLIAISYAIFLYLFKRQ
ncbi:MAG TPA: hypothetical protein VK206_03325 [Anaerolineales bacterium]|nr:hypothetical protein [Anaerolineales bacterium]